LFLDWKFINKIIQIYILLKSKVLMAC